MFKLNADTDEVRRTGLERAIYKYGIIICTCESSILLHLKKRDLIVSRLTLTTGQRAYQVKARKGSTRMPLVILASVKYHTWDREMHDLLAQVGLQEKVVPVLVDVFPEQEKLKMHAALRLHGGLRFAFAQATHFTPTHVDFVVDNLRSELIAVKEQPHIKMFSKTDFTKGVVVAVPITQCVPIFEKLVMAAD